MPRALLFEDLKKSLPLNSFANSDSISLTVQPDLDISIIVLDDDPTGTQTVHGVPVITEWSTEAIESEFKLKTPLFFILTNSRSLPEMEADTLALEIGRNIKIAAHKSQRNFRIISRSDSTLRGHYPSEVDQLESTLYDMPVIHVLIPAFFEGGRMTVDGVHYVQEKENLIPAADTPFALDAAFGYKNSRLTEWVKEKTKGKKDNADILSIPLTLIRQGGVEAVFNALVNIHKQSVVIVDAFAYSDLNIVTLAFRKAEALGKIFLYRTGASFVRSYAGITAKGDWNPKELPDTSSYGGLIVVGSYVPKTTAQLHYFREKSSVVALELSLSPDYSADQMRAQADTLLVKAENAIRNGKDVLIYTSRKLILKTSMSQNLDYGNSVSQLLVHIVHSLSVKPKFLIAKGGITSSDIATKALEVKRALVLGQLIPGVPVWKTGPESKFPGMPYFIFPGNVGSESALFEAYQILKGEG